nr:MAG TPA: hypothetical protein [Caudoviricetes sp.]
MIQNSRNDLKSLLLQSINVSTNKRKDYIMAMTNEEKYEKNYQGFMKELTRISKKYGIGINACGCFDYYDWLCHNKWLIFDEK